MDKNNRKKLLLFDLDDTLLRSDKTISERTLEALRKCREKGVLIGISTSRAVHNCMTFLPELTPDLFIASGGAVIQYHGDYIYTAEFTIEEGTHDGLLADTTGKYHELWHAQAQYYTEQPA